MSSRPKQTKYKTIEIDELPSTDEEALQLFRQLVREDREDKEGFSLFPKDIPPRTSIVCRSGNSAGNGQRKTP